jgi:signal transduction histidine kinase
MDVPSSHPLPASTSSPGWWRSLLLRAVGHILVEDGELLERWQSRLTAAFLAATATFGVLPTLSTVAVLLRDGRWALVVLDSVIMLTVFWLLLSRRPSNRLRNLFLTGACLAIGITALVTLGPFSTALGWLFMSVFLAAFLLGTRWTIATVSLVLLLLASVSVGIAQDAFEWSVNVPEAMSRWTLTALDFTFLIVVFAAANVLTMRLLAQEDRARFEAERRLADGRRQQALGTLASGIAHDFNNLLVPILANVELAQQSLPDGDEARQPLDEARRSAERARELVRRVLAFGRDADLPRIPVDPAECVQDVLELVRSTTPPGVTIEAVIDDSATVLASSGELHRIVHNLVSNAVLATEPTGTVTLTLRTEIGGLPDPADPARRVDALVLSVVDTGVGMDDATMSRIFDPYFTSRAPGQGSGLGLPIARSIAETLGGSIEVLSAPGAGSTFTVRLPQAPREVAPVPTDGDSSRHPSLAASRSAQPRDAVPAALRVLLVDDEEGVRTALSRQLRALGCDVTAAEGVSQACDLLRGTVPPFALLITDHRMPGRSGVELVATARRDHPAVRIVLMSGDVSDALRDGEMLRQVVPLQKPFTRQELASAIQLALAPTTAS